MKITDIDLIPIFPKLPPSSAAQPVRFSAINNRTIFKVTLDNGVVGWGDYRCGPPEKSSVAGLIGQNPLNFINANRNAGLMGALYDAMGKSLEVPAYKLMGQKVRDRVPVAAWTRPASPEDLAYEVKRAADQGYLFFKMHTCQHYDVLEQNKAVEDVAPDGFKFHYDFNHNRPLIAVIRLVQALEKSPVVGLIEDPIIWQDIDGWRQLREKTCLPLLMHVPQLGGGPELLNRSADAFMVGEIGFGKSLALGAACAQANISTVIQLTGGSLTKAFAMHLGAVLPLVSHCTNLDDQYEEDVVKTRLPIDSGSSPVPETPGLGLEIDEEALARCAANPPLAVPKHLGVTTLPGNRTLYTPSFPNLERVTGFPEGNIRGVYCRIWEDDGSPEFEQRFAQVQQQGSVLE